MKDKIFDLEGKTALITGSSQGLGYVMARGIGRAGAAVIINGRSKDKVDKAVKNLKDDGIKAFASVFDITKKEEINKEVDNIEKKIGHIDILINNAGIQRRIPLEDFSESDWREVLDINLTGTFLVTQQVVKGMIKRKSGKIINICSLQSELGRKTIAPYAASKGGLKMLTRAMAVEWGEYNIQANAIGPGYFLTEMTQKLADNKEFDSWLKGRTPADRWGDPEELVGTGVFLASKASDFINGQIIYVDGGILASM